MRYAWIQVVFGIVILLVITLHMGNSDKTVTTSQVQQSFRRNGLKTEVLVGPNGCPTTFRSRSQKRLNALLSACAPGAPYAGHLEGLIVDRASLAAKRPTGWVIAAYVLDSPRAAAKAFAPTPLSGTLTPLQIRVRNVLVLLQPQGKAYETKLRAALSTLG